MTHVYDWNWHPRELTVRCPQCDGPALVRVRDGSWSDGPLRGRLACSQCHRVQPRFVVAWPDKAFFRWTVRGRELWAWSREHAIAIRDYVQSDARDKKAYPGHFAGLL